ncbi:universal stress protein [Cupriavidus basilensis]|uniref:Universal stress protein n=1 Tax=Cupriavidus basilensis TaxID=68895 RepID=A0ABT6B2M3_9BURK|nr:universal stress protein [Cupriavidus basilensis]MDF3838196.1 universal stress protein [Cupriavidus basilensis]
MYQRILLAVDGSRSAELALSQAIIVAKATGSEVQALYVADDNDVFFLAGSYDPRQLTDAILAAGREALEAAAKRLAEAGIPHTTKLLEKPVSPGQISSTIVEEAERWDADLIVLGTHGRRGIRRLIMGSVSEGVLHRSNKPVLMVRSEIKE